MKASGTTVPLRLDVVEFLCGGAAARELVMSHEPPIFMTVNCYYLLSDMSEKETTDAIEAALGRS